jgi:hypothetical protein
VNRTILFWTLALFFGASIAFRAIQNATTDSPLLVTLGLEVALLIALVVTIVVVGRRRDRDGR